MSRPCADPFADEAAEVEEEDDNNVVKGKSYVHVRVQQRNGRKSLTTVQARLARARRPPARSAPLLWPSAHPPRSRVMSSQGGNPKTVLLLRSRVAPVQGIDATVDYKKVLKAFKKEFCCNGTVVEDPEQARGRGSFLVWPLLCADGVPALRDLQGHVIQLQGDQRKNVSSFLIAEGIVKKDVIKIHGF